MSDDDLFPTAMEVRILTGMITKMAKHDMERRLEAHGIAVGALPFGIMQLLNRRPQTITELSRTMKLAPATLVPAVDALERRGLARRGSDPSDRRRNPLSLTELGVKALASVPLVGSEDALLCSLSAMSRQKRINLQSLLRELVTRMGGDPCMPDGITTATQAIATPLR